MPKSITALIVSLLALSCIGPTQGHENDPLDPMASLFAKTTIAAEIKYREVDGTALRLDVYAPSRRLGESPWVEYDAEPKPVLLYFHGGGWRNGEKESRTLEILPYVAEGWVVITANYRLLPEATLPKIIGDCRTALDWVVRNADRYGGDRSKIFLAGNSAGGHLAMMTGLIADDCYFESYIRSGKIPKISGIINWYGITDVALFVNDWKDRGILWDGKSDFGDMCTKTSPLHHLSADSPPIFTIHGSSDPVVPFEHAQILHKRSKELGHKSVLYEVPNRKHGNFSPREMTEIYREIWRFIAEIEGKGSPLGD